MKNHQKPLVFQGFLTFFHICSPFILASQNISFSSVFHFKILQKSSEKRSIFRLGRHPVARRSQNWCRSSSRSLKNGSEGAREGPETLPDGPGSVPGPVPTPPRASQKGPRGVPGRSWTPPKWSPDSPDTLRAAAGASWVPPSLPGTKFEVHSGYIPGLPSPYFLPMYARISADTSPSAHVLSDPPTSAAACAKHIEFLLF